MSNKQRSSCSQSGARMTALASQRWFRALPADMPFPLPRSGTVGPAKPLPVRPPFAGRSQEGSECLSRLGRVRPCPAHPVLRAALAPPLPRRPSPAALPPFPRQSWLSWGAVLPDIAFWPIFQRAWTGAPRCRGSGARQSSGGPLRSRAAPPAARAPPGGSREPKLIHLLRTGQGRKGREVLLFIAPPAPPAPQNIRTPSLSTRRSTLQKEPPQLPGPCLGVPAVGGGVLPPRPSLRGARRGLPEPVCSPPAFPNTGGGGGQPGQSGPLTLRIPSPEHGPTNMRERGGAAPHSLRRRRVCAPLLS